MNLFYSPLLHCLRTSRCVQCFLHAHLPELFWALPSLWQMPFISSGYIVTLARAHARVRHQQRGHHFREGNRGTAMACSCLRYKTFTLTGALRAQLGEDGALGHTCVFNIRMTPSHIFYSFCLILPFCVWARRCFSVLCIYLTLLFFLAPRTHTFCRLRLIYLFIHFVQLYVCEIA